MGGATLSPTAIAKMLLAKKAVHLPSDYHLGVSAHHCACHYYCSFPQITHLHFHKLNITKMIMKNLTTVLIPLHSTLNTPAIFQTQQNIQKLLFEVWYSFSYEWHSDILAIFSHSTIQPRVFFPNDQNIVFVLFCACCLFINVLISFMWLDFFWQLYSEWSSVFRAFLWLVTFVPVNTVDICVYVPSASTSVIFQSRWNVESSHPSVFFPSLAYACPWHLNIYLKMSDMATCFSSTALSSRQRKCFPSGQQWP